MLVTLALLSCLLPFPTRPASDLPARAPRAQGAETAAGCAAGPSGSLALRAPWPRAAASRPPASACCGPGPRSPKSERSRRDRKSTRLNSSHLGTSYAVFCLKNKQAAALESRAVARVDERRIVQLVGELGRPRNVAVAP